MALTLDQLITSETRETVEDELLQVASTLGLPARSWEPLGVARTILATVAQKVADYSAMAVEVSKGGFLDLASPEWQALLASSVFGVEKNYATAATGSITLTNPGAVTYTFAAGDLTLANSSTSKTYTNTSTGTLSPSSTLTLSIEANEVGTASNAAPNQIRTIVTPSMPGVTATNAASVLGSDDETTEQLAARCRQKLASLSPNGPADAYSYVAKSTTGLSSPITRTAILLDPTTGIVNVIIANANGAPTSGDVALVDAQIQSKAVPATVTATTTAATTTAIDVTCAVWVSNLSGTLAQVRDAISTAISGYFSTVGVGGVFLPGAVNGYVFRDKLFQVIFGAWPGITHVTISIPSSDTLLSSTAVPVLGAYSCTVNA